MCNLYNDTSAVEATRGLFRALEHRAGNIESGDVDLTAPLWNAISPD